MIAVLLIALSLVAPATWVETYYSRAFYPWLQSWLVPLTGLLPFPLMAVVIAGVCVALPAWIWFAWQRARREGVGIGERFGRGGLWSLRHGLLLYAAFLVLWGFGYRRVTLPERWGLEKVKITKHDRKVFEARMRALIWRDCPPDHRRSRTRAARAIRAAQRRLVARMDGFEPSFPRRAKSLPAGFLMSFDVTGVVSPWTLEAHVDSALPREQWLGVYAHELAHLAGYCGEADANLVGYLAGLRSDDRYARYACALAFIRQTGRARDQLPKLARRDLQRIHAARLAHRNEHLARSSGLIYHRYLKSQGVSRGLRDYGHGWDWLIRCWKRGMLPELGRI